MTLQPPMPPLAKPSGVLLVDHTRHVQAQADDYFAARPSVQEKYRRLTAGQDLVALAAVLVALMALPLVFRDRAGSPVKEDVATVIAVELDGQAVKLAWRDGFVFDCRMRHLYHAALGLSNAASI